MSEQNKSAVVRTFRKEGSEVIEKTRILTGTEKTKAHIENVMAKLREERAAVATAIEFSKTRAVKDVEAKNTQGEAIELETQRQLKAKHDAEVELENVFQQHKEKLSAEEIGYGYKVIRARLSLIQAQEAVKANDGWRNSEKLSVATKEYNSAVQDAQVEEQRKANAIADLWNKPRTSTATVYHVVSGGYYLCHDNGRAFVATESDLAHGLRFNILTRGNGSGPLTIVTSTYKDVPDIDASAFNDIVKAKPSYDELTRVCGLMTNYKLIISTANAIQVW